MLSLSGRFGPDRSFFALVKFAFFSNWFTKEGDTIGLKTENESLRSESTNV